jgi:hypothetical protein
LKISTCFKNKTLKVQGHSGTTGPIKLAILPHLWFYCRAIFPLKSTELLRYMYVWKLGLDIFKKQWKRISYKWPTKHQRLAVTPTNSQQSSDAMGLGFRYPKP